MSQLKAPALIPTEVPARTGSNYPPEFASVCAGREKRALGDAAGLKNFGVNLTTLRPGAASSQRHWHTAQDEFIYVLDGEVTLITDEGEQTLRAGMAAGFPAGAPEGHCLVNRTDRDASYLEIGDRAPTDEVNYPEIDLAVRLIVGRRRYVRKDGTFFEGRS
jgi:uncharacterized cupin superfamily protein